LNDDLFMQGLDLMLVGMGTVFVFLTLLVLATALMSHLVRRFLPPAASAGAIKDGPHPEEVAAITAAVLRYREERR
jgi:oxaloacetate decarboxylase gamma subunit